MTIVANNLVKQYKKRIVVNKVSIKVNRGEIVGILGPNGAGKTTTFAMIVGLEKADSGQIRLDDKDITRVSMYLRGRLGIGYLPQEPSVFRKLTVTDNIVAVLELMGYPQEKIQARLSTLLMELRLEEVRNQLGLQLSGGERRRTEIARALAAEPSFILLDEPFAGIDPIAVADIQEIIKELKAKNIGVLITDHNVRETLSITDQAYILREGEVLVSGSAQQVSEDALARQYYLGANFIN